MKIFRRRNRQPKKPNPAAPLVGIGLLVALLVAGVVVWLTGWTGGSKTAAHPASRISSAPAPRPTPSASTTGGLSADQIANKPMVGAGHQAESDAQPATEVAATTPALTLPASTRQVSGVATGFPRTPEGAVAQLTAMDISGFRDFDMDNARTVYNTFTTPGSVGMDYWMPTRLISQYFVDNPDQSADQMSASYQPVQAVIKGVADGGNTVVVCLNGRLSYSYSGHAETTGAQWDCARMGWSKDQRMWMFAKGTAPSPAPLTWPRDALSYKAGFRDLSNLPG